MKKNLLTLGLAAVLSVSLLAGCSSSAEETTAAETEAATEAATEEAAEEESTEDASEEAADAETTAFDGKLGVIVLEADHGWTAGVSYYAEQKCDEMGIDYQIYTSNNVNDQANQIEQAISDGCTAIVLEPHTDEVSIAAQAIPDAGIPLVLFDRTVTGDYDAYVAGDNPGIGTAGAKEIGELLGGQGTVIVHNVPSSGVVSTDRVDAFKAEMEAGYPDIKLIDITTDDFTQESGLKAMTDALVANPEIDAVFSIDDESSLGFLRAINDAGRTDIQLMTGCGGAQAYFNAIAEQEGAPELITATYSPMMIQDAIDVAIEIANGGTVEKEVIVPPTIVSKDNVDEFLDSSSPY